jgi:hypothetical protein
VTTSPYGIRGAGQDHAGLRSPRHGLRVARPEQAVGRVSPDKPVTSQQSMRGRVPSVSSRDNLVDIGLIEDEVDQVSHRLAAQTRTLRFAGYVNPISACLPSAETHTPTSRMSCWSVDQRFRAGPRFQEGTIVRRSFPPETDSPQCPARPPNLDTSRSRHRADRLETERDPWESASSGGLGRHPCGSGSEPMAISWRRCCGVQNGDSPKMG